MNKQELMKRYLLLVCSLFFAALGVAMAKCASLGVSPISSVANVMSIQFPHVTLGTWLMLWNGVMILCQILILRRQFRLYQLLQIPVSLLFGWFTDLGVWLVSPIPTPNYLAQLLLAGTGILVLGFGLSLSVIANVVMNSGEALVKAISDTSGKEFGSVKVCFDVSCVILSAAMSMLFFRGQIMGVREGTILTALLTGHVVKFFTKRLKAPFEARL